MLVRRGIDARAGAPARFSVDREKPLVPADDAKDHRQTQPCALAHRLGREKGIERLVEHLRRHAAAAVLDLRDKVVARRHVFRKGRLAGFQELAAHAKRDARAIDQGVASVDGQVDERLLELVGVRLDVKLIGFAGRRALDLHVDVHRARDQLGGGLDQLGQGNGPAQ